MAEDYFADTSFWIALSSKRDQHHPRAVQWSRHILASEARLLTTEAVLWEWLNAMAHPATRSIVAAGYRRCHSDPSIRVVPFEERLQNAALDLFESRNDKAWSLTDCFSFVAMKEQGLFDALSTDHHFGQAGFRSVMQQSPPGTTA